MILTVFGIPNCNTIKKTIDWLKSNHIDFEFHNYKTQGITKTLLTDFCKQVGWEALLNKKGTTWKKLTEAEQASATNTKNVVNLLSEHTSMIKRPVITLNNEVVAVGFDENTMLAIKSKL